MRTKPNILLNLSVTALVVTLFFGCEGNMKNVQMFHFSEFMPTGEADSIHLHYTDSGRVKSVLKSPKMLDYGSVAFPFTEFPKGIHMTIVDENQRKSVVIADYAVTFKDTELIDLRGNVKLISPDGQTLATEQLYFDQKREWFFTEKPFTFVDEKGMTSGVGIDFNKTFTRVKYKKVYGEIDEAVQP